MIQIIKTNPDQFNIWKPFSTLPESETNQFDLKSKVVAISNYLREHDLTFRFWICLAIESSSTLRGLPDFYVGTENDFQLSREARGRKLEIAKRKLAAAAQRLQHYGGKCVFWNSIASLTIAASLSHNMMYWFAKALS